MFAFRLISVASPSHRPQAVFPKFRSFPVAWRPLVMGSLPARSPCLTRDVCASRGCNMMDKDLVSHGLCLFVIGTWLPCDWCMIRMTGTDLMSWISYLYTWLLYMYGSPMLNKYFMQFSAGGNWSSWSVHDCLVWLTFSIWWAQWGIFLSCKVCW